MSGKINTLVLCSDPWHSTCTVKEGLGALQQNDFAFDWIENPGEWSRELMNRYPLVILTRSNRISAEDQTGWITHDIQTGFSDYVCRGNGLLAIHSGTANYENAPVLRSLLGGIFTHHPDPCPVTVEPHAGHPLCVESEPFTLLDEHYFMTLDDQEIDVFMTTRSGHGEQPGAWRRTEGSGRVAVLTPGHRVEVWQHPSFQALLLNSMRWCAKLL